MRLAYANAKYVHNDTRGRNAHIGQFIAGAVALGHEVWGWPGNEHSSVRIIPSGRLRRILALRQMDVIYTRLQQTPASACYYALPPQRQLVGSPLMVWEFNTIPEFDRLLGKSQDDVEKTIQVFRQLGQGCDLAICVSSAISQYVKGKLNIPNTLTVPNGSDPDLFRPDVVPVRRVERIPDRLNVAWIGSAELSWHNFELMRAAAEMLWQLGEGDRVAFHIIGQQFRMMRDMPPNIHYYGADDYEAIPHWLAAMDVGLCLYHPGPADYNSPLKLFDYMASGLAVVATTQPQVSEVFDQLGQPDLIVEPDDPSTLAGILLRLGQNQARTRSLGQAGRQLVIDYYNWDRAVNDTFHAIQMLLADKPGRKTHGQSYALPNPE
jgi:glycosyltransferase involved in cell wall biosynthesis